MLEVGTRVKIIGDARAYLASCNVLYLGEIGDLQGKIIAINPTREEYLEKFTEINPDASDVPNMLVYFDEALNRNFVVEFKDVEVVA